MAEEIEFEYRHFWN